MSDGDSPTREPDGDQLLFLGTGSPLAPAFSTSVLLNGTLLFDAPGGITYRLKQEDVDMEDIDAIFLTHYHGDHFLGLPNLLLNNMFRERPLHIVGPQDPEAKTRTLLDLSFKQQVDLILDNANVEFHGVDGEISDESIPPVNFHSYRLDHEEEPVYGYRLGLTNGQFGITGDTTECPNLERLLDGSDFAVVDMTFEETTDTHLGVEYVKTIHQRFGVERVFAVHRSMEIYDEVTSVPDTILPSNGEVYDL
jgi:ribonuclease BN (tRNA processing enzyme)